MRRLPHFRQFPRLYQVIVILFAAIDALALVIAVARHLSWSHAGGSVLGSVVWVLFLYPFFAPIPPPESYPHAKRSASTARIVAGVVILFLSGWSILGGVDEFARGVVADNILEIIVFEIFLTLMGALLVWRGWQRRRGMTWDTFPGSGLIPGPPTSRQTLSPGEKRTSVVAVIAFFILGSAVLYSLNFYSGTIGFQPFGLLVIPAGIVAAAAILTANRRLLRKARICLGCGQRIPSDANVCPNCGRPFQ